MRQVDDFDLTVDSPSAAGAASPAAAAEPSPELAAPQTEPSHADAASAYTAQWLETLQDPAEAEVAHHSAEGFPGPYQTLDTAAEDVNAAAPQQESEESSNAAHHAAAADVDNSSSLQDRAPAASRAEAEAQRLSLTAPEGEEGEMSINFHFLHSS